MLIASATKPVSELLLVPFRKLDKQEIFGPEEVLQYFGWQEFSKCLESTLKPKRCFAMKWITDFQKFVSLLKPNISSHPALK